MSPRSAELLQAARDRLPGAELALAGGSSALAVSAAYYAILYAARAALSEEGRFANSPRNVGPVHHDVRGYRSFRSRARSAARTREEARGAADYDARTFPADEAAAVIVDARACVEATSRMLEA